MQTKTYTTNSVEETVELGRAIGMRLRGGEVVELLSDLGGGKTTFTKGLAAGFGSDDPVASPSFTISFVYTTSEGKQLHHFDFYRLDDAGIVAHELAEVEGDENAVVVVEWGEVVHEVLPKDRIIVTIQASQDENRRNITVTYPDTFSYVFSA